MEPGALRKVLPGMFTLANILCGFLAIINTIDGLYVTAAWWIIIAAVFDALDGKVARLMRASSDFGVELDSIADVISFGVAPSVLFYSYIFADAGRIGIILAFAYLSAGAFRLARFNTTATTGSKSGFTGMPIPSGAGILSSFILFSENVWGGFASFDLAMVLVLLTSLAMISNFKYSLLPKIGFATRKDIARSVWFITHMFFVIRFPDEVFFPTGIMYLLSGPVRYIFAPTFNRVFNHASHKIDGR